MSSKLMPASIVGLLGHLAVLSSSCLATETSMTGKEDSKGVLEQAVEFVLPSVIDAGEVELLIVSYGPDVVRAENLTIVRDGNVVRVRGDSNSIPAGSSFPPVEETVSLGFFKPGNYDLEAEIFGFATGIQHTARIIFAVQAAPVPTSSIQTMLVLIVSILIVARWVYPKNATCAPAEEQ